MVYSSQGVVLQTIPYSESSMILHIYTEIGGRKSYMAKGIRKGKSGKNALSVCQAGTMVEVVSNAGKSTMETLRELRVARPFEQIPFSISKTAVLLFMNEVIYKSIREEEQNKSLFQFLTTTLLTLDSTDEQIGEFPAFFLLRFADVLGFRPMNNYHQTQSPYFCMQKGKFVHDFTSTEDHLNVAESHTLHQLLNASQTHDYQSLHLSYEMRGKMLNRLIAFYQLHVLGVNVLKSHEVLHTVLQ